MSTFVLLNRDGTLARKLALVSLPPDYEIPEGKILSWRTVLQKSSRDPLINFDMRNREPLEAFFYLGSAWAQVTRAGWTDCETDSDHRMWFGVHTLTITVQAKSTADLVTLRDQILEIIRTCVRYEVSNDLNPKPKPSLRKFLRSLICRRQPQTA
ncbi:MAG: hypothetical protein PHH01_01815 [Patescibacteria group bacterium]|nr:hypothetical protein [Patescibacteria group bacterium]